MNSKASSLINWLMKNVLRKGGDQTLTGDLTVTGKLLVTGDLEVEEGDLVCDGSISGTSLKIGEFTVLSGQLEEISSLDPAATTGDIVTAFNLLLTTMKAQSLMENP